MSDIFLSLHISELNVRGVHCQIPSDDAVCCSRRLVMSLCSSVCPLGKVPMQSDRSRNIDWSGFSPPLPFLSHPARGLWADPILHADGGGGERGLPGPRHSSAPPVHGNGLRPNPGHQRESRVQPQPQVHQTGGGSPCRVSAHHLHCPGPWPLHEADCPVRTALTVYQTLLVKRVTVVFRGGSDLSSKVAKH